jgi:hypothetical protein
MSLQKHDDDCPGCRPVLLDANTRQPLSSDSPEMQAVNRMWSSTTLDEREAFHRVTCLNSRADEDLTMVQDIAERISAALENVS